VKVGVGVASGADVDVDVDDDEGAPNNVVAPGALSWLEVVEVVGLFRSEKRDGTELVDDAAGPEGVLPRRENPVPAPPAGADDGIAPNSGTGFGASLVADDEGAPKMFAGLEPAGAVPKLPTPAELLVLFCEGAVPKRFDFGTSALFKLKRLFAEESAAGFPKGGGPAGVVETSANINPFGFAGAGVVLPA